MEFKRVPFCVLVPLFLACTIWGGTNQQNEPKPKLRSVTGRIIGYSKREELRMSGFMGVPLDLPHSAFLFLVAKGDGELKSGEFIKMQYRATQKQKELLPAAYFNESKPISIVLQRNESCDESTESFVFDGSFPGQSRSDKDKKRFPNLTRIDEAKNTPLPEAATLRCYTFGGEDNKL